ncbi:MAG: small multi-drug export protein [Candidatus Diapherotrites archaeon]|uniref:Small multi-drug export protein n=1 Tax=Candidatus Iainarchaeum sp. TaxID=3101447 RepID=A0A938YN70_9ARCH|nr:small multi-drug export protein [Candidatus Diapherotrites archaeon]
MDIHNFIELALLTLTPALELRASIPYGILLAKLAWPEVLAVVVAVNAILGIALFLALGWLVRISTRVRFIKDIYMKIVARTQRKASPLVERYGTIGIALFIGIPLPGSGVWTGALAAYLLGMKFRKFLIADIIGVLIAAAAVTALSLGLLNGF